MPQPDNRSASKSGEQKQDKADSAGQRSSAGSNYGDWRPDPQTGKTGAPGSKSAAGSTAGGDGKAGQRAESPSGTTPSTAPSGIGSKPNK